MQLEERAKERKRKNQKAERPRKEWLSKKILINLLIFGRILPQVESA
jgi:hypothetical protein